MRQASDAEMRRVTATEVPARKMNWSDTVLRLVGLVTVAGMVLPFASDGSAAGKISTALINLVIGLAIGTLLTAVLARTITDTERSWQH